jgi:1,2-diacylglycerol 3-alpha-glucosyltransferase
MRLFFISKSANWQKYRLEILTKLTETYNYDVEILTTGKLKPFLSSNNSVKYKIFKSTFPQRAKFSFMPGILHYILKNRPDAVLCLNNSTQLTEYFALILCKLLKIKFIWWTHGYDHGISNLPRFVKFFKQKYVMFFLNLGDSIIVFSDKGKDFLISNGTSKHKIFVAPNSLDTKKIISQKNNVDVNHVYEDYLKIFEIDDDTKIILFSGKLYKEKKVENAIKAFKLINREIPNSKLVIIGDGEELTNLKNMISPLQDKNILFLGEVFDEKLLNIWFTNAHVYLMPGVVGLSIIHAFCYGLPFITEDIIGHGPEIQFLKNGINGYLLKENNIEEMSQCVIELLMNETKRISFSQQALLTAQKEGDIENMINKMSLALTFEKQP